jgi:hypothetical protein
MSNTLTSIETLRQLIDEKKSGLKQQDLSRKQEQSALKKLERDYQRQKQRLEQLSKRKQRLESELEQVESQIRSTKGETVPAEVTAPVPLRSVAQMPAATPAKSRTFVSRSGAPNPASLPGLLLVILQDANGRPLSFEELEREVLRRGYQTTSTKLRRVIHTRMFELVKRKVARWSPNRVGLVLVKQSPNGQATAPKPVRPRVPASRAASTAKVGSSRRGQIVQQPTLRSYILRVLKRSPRPLTPSEIAAQVAATGYQSHSANFNKVVRDMLNRMKNVRQTVRGYVLRPEKG